MRSEERLQEELAQIRARERSLDEENNRLRNELSMHQVRPLVLPSDETLLKRII